MSEGLFAILPKLACNPLQDMVEGSSSRGLLAIVFPNGEAMFNWFKTLNENSLKQFSILSTLGLKLPTIKLGTIPSPVGLPDTPFTKSRSRGD